MGPGGACGVVGGVVLALLLSWEGVVTGAGGESTNGSREDAPRLRQRGAEGGTCLAAIEPRCQPPPRGSKNGVKWAIFLCFV